MKQIILFRHGKVDIKNNKKISAFKFQDWIEEYNNCDIIFDKTVFKNKEIVENSDVIICSNLKRSIQSAKFFNKEILINDEIFNEVEIPYPKWSILKLSPNMWLIIFRILWFLGYSKNCESYKNAKQRAKKAASKLTKLAKEYNKIILFGHGIFNRLILREMISRDWKIMKKIESQNWGYGIIEIDNKLLERNI